ncbi:MAG: leucine-rich repeat protein, partial [Anaeroplasmataceae bacterium]|nr:leucine-rich repeat protein [Anaeroplasmataceae bacterium]
VFDNHYVQSITPVFLRQGEDGEMTYSMLSTPIPVYGEKGEITKVRFEITDYLNELYSDEMMPNGLAFSIDDYALNTNIYVCELPGTRGGFKFTEDGTMNGENMNLVVGNVGEIIDLIPYLASSDSTISQGNDYLKYLTWTSANEKVAVVKEGQVYALSSGRVRITVYERMRNLSASITVLINPKSNSINLSAITPETENLKNIRFSYFDTIYAHPSCNTNQDIGEIGSRKYLSLMDHDSNGSPMIDIYPGEVIKLSPVIDPWYLPESRYELRYSSTNESVATVDENGVVKALKKGNCTIRLNIIVDGKQSNMLATLKLSVQSEFVIEGMTLVAYKGMGGDVVIPDDEGIVYIGSFAFSLYEIDKNISLPEDDYDANKIAGENHTITSVTIPSGVQDIQKFAFANCYELTKVTLPDSIKFIRENAFYNDSKLTTINMEDVQAICSYAFTNCTSLNNIDLSKTYSIAIQAFYGCSSLTEVDLSALRNSGKEVFANCTNLKSVKFSNDTKLSEGMFKNSGLEIVDFGVKRIPAECFAQCANLTSVVAKNDLIDLGYHAFADCPNLKSIDLQGALRYLYDEVFLNCTNLENVSLPNSSFTVGNRVFANCTKLTSLEFKEDTLWLSVGKGILVDSSVSSFDTSLSNHYSSNDGVLLDLSQEAILLVAPMAALGDYVIPASIKRVGDGAFSWMDSLTKLTIESSDLILGDYAFANCEALTEVVLPESGIVISNEAFLGCTSLNQVENLDQVTSFGKSSFSNTSLTNIIIADEAEILDHAFAGIGTLTNISLGKNVSLSTGAFQNCGRLVEVNIALDGSLTIGDEAFANDNQLTTINLSQASGKIGARAFYGTKLTSVDLSAIDEVGAMAFADCNMLSSVLLTKVQKIGAYAFASVIEDSDGTILSQVSLPDSLVSLGEGAFKGCKTLVSIHLPDALELIESNTFADCKALKTVENAANILSVGTNAFSNCNALDSIDLSNVEFIGDYAFLNCTSLKEVDFASLEKVGFGSFASSGIQSINSALKLKRIEGYAFQSTGLTSVSLPLLEVVKEGAFSNCNSLVDFAFTSNIKEIDISVFYYSNKLTHIYMLDQDQKKESGILNEYALIENNILYKTTLAGNLVLVAVPAALNLENLIVKEGTSVIDPYAGNQNPFIKSIVLPDSLNTIGNFAFYGCNKLTSVEFKSYIAPTLESSYVAGSQLNTTDPGYEKLHYFFDFLGTESGYFHFIDLVGKRNPIQMILPANEDAQGYDSIIYEVFFGSASDAKRSDYIAKNTLTTRFLKLIVQIPEVITLADEALILEVNSLKNSMRQDLTIFGYSQEEVNQMNLKLEKALLKIKELKLAISSDSLKALQAEINALDTTFKIENLESLRSLTARIDSISREEKNILDLRKYDELVSSYSAYISNVNDEFKPIDEVVSSSFDYRSLLIAVAYTTSFAMAMAYLVSKKWF